MREGKLRTGVRDRLHNLGRAGAVQHRHQLDRGARRDRRQQRQTKDTPDHRRIREDFTGVLVQRNEASAYELASEIRSGKLGSMPGAAIPQLPHQLDHTVRVAFAELVYPATQSVIDGSDARNDVALHIGVAQRADCNAYAVAMSERSQSRRVGCSVASHRRDD
jgi:hypothetical protein